MPEVQALQKCVLWSDAERGGLMYLSKLDSCLNCSSCRGSTPGHPEFAIATCEASYASNTPMTELSSNLAVQLGPLCFGVNAEAPHHMQAQSWVCCLQVCWQATLFSWLGHPS